MNLENIINNYGYAALVIGTFLEGETILVLGGVAAKLGYLKLQWVMVAAFVGSLCGDQLYFYMGRRYGARLLARKPQWAAKAQNVYSVFNRYENAVLLGFRFVYGMRTVTPIALGAGKLVSPLKFLVFNTISAALWSAFVSGLGFAIGHGAELLLGDIKQYEIAVMSGVALLSLSIWLWHLLRKKYLIGRHNHDR